jgi:hypothetical protein
MPVSLSVSMLVFKIMCEFCYVYFKWLVPQQITFNAYLLPEKPMDNFYSNFCWQRTTFSTCNPGKAGDG